MIGNRYPIRYKGKAYWGLPLVHPYNENMMPIFETNLDALHRHLIGEHPIPHNVSGGLDEASESLRRGRRRVFLLHSLSCHDAFLLGCLVEKGL